jgi:TRAP-type C4-dicarboxylate transport system permease small subunit
MARLTRLVASVAFIALLGMVGVTLADIALRLVSRLPGEPLARLIPAAVPGVVDLVQLTLVTVAHLSIAVTFLVGTHVTVDIVATKFPERMRAVTRRACWALSFAFMAGCFVQASTQARGQFGEGLVSATISLPLWWYWIPVVLGTALAAFACFVHFVRGDAAERRDA